MPAKITSFKGDFGFLSNFHEASIWIDGKRYPSVEHAYQAFKFGPDGAGHELVRNAATPAKTKKLGKSAQLPPDWDTKKLELMRRFVTEKFKNPLLRAMLVATGDAELVEGNWWGDRFWGVCKGTGENWLGRILMDVRKEAQAEVG